MNKWVLLSITLFSAVVHADPLLTFNDIAAAISEGKKITLVMDLQKCSSQNKGPVLASVRPDAFMVINNDRITTSIRHFTLDNPIARGNPTFEFVKYNINSDGNVAIKNTVMNATNYQQLAIFEAECLLNKGFMAYS